MMKRSESGVKADGANAVDHHSAAGGGHRHDHQPLLQEENPSPAAGGGAAASPHSKEQQQNYNKATSSAEERWTDMFHRLVKYKHEHGDCQVPNRYEQDPKLGAWVSTQRRHYRVARKQNVESHSLTPDRIQRLEDIGFGWMGVNPRYLHWDVRYKELLQFKQRFGHVNIPINWPENVKLANWTSTQRQEYKNKSKGKKSRLDNRRIDLLNDVGFAWELQRGGRKRKLTAASGVADSEEEEGRPDKIVRTGGRRFEPKDKVTTETAAASPGVAAVAKASKPPPQHEQAANTDDSCTEGPRVGVSDEASSMLALATSPLGSALNPFASATAGTITAASVRTPAPGSALDLVSLALMRLQQTDSTQALRRPAQHLPNVLEELALLQQIQAQGALLGNRAQQTSLFRDRSVTNLNTLHAQILIRQEQQQLRQQLQQQHRQQASLLAQFFLQQQPTSVAAVPSSNNQLLQSLALSLDAGNKPPPLSSTPFVLNPLLNKSSVTEGPASAPSSSATVDAPGDRTDEDLDQKPPAHGP